MTTINSLPPECLEHILLQLGRDSLALSQLMRVNKSLFQLVVPILYADPFSVCSFASRPKLHKALLDSVNISFIESFLEATRGQCGSLACTTKCRAIANTPTDQKLISATKKPTTTTMGRYMESLAVIDGQIWMVYATRCMGHGFKHLTAKFYLHILITILRKSAHRIAFMVFLPGYICPVMPFASRMRSLTRVQFAGSYNSQEMSHIIQFLRLRQGHGKIPGAGGLGLRECNLPLLTLSDSVDKTHHHQHHHHHHHHHQHKQLNTMQLSQRGQIQQLQLIHSLGRPLSLDASSYWDFFSISHVVSRHTLSRLEKFKHVHGFLGAAGGNFLRRCRALQELEFGSFDKNSFSWAEDEKTQRIQDTFGTEIIEGSEDFASPLVQLREARLTVSEWLVGHILKSVAYGFTHSLENLLFNVCDHDQLLHVLCASKVSQIERDAAPDKTFCIDYSFRLPKLKKLRLVRLTNKIAIGQGAFQGCPELESLFISGPVTRVQDKQEFFDVFHNPKLKLLELGHGGASVHFNFQSLEYSPLLESLALREYLPEELENLEPPMLDPVPWTWKLEQLTVIQMSGRPAFHFRFEWIRCCRSLQTLVVDGVTHTALQPNKEDIKKGKCGAQLRTCDLQVYTMQDFDKSNLAQLIETYCAHVNQLKLNGGRSASEQYPWRNIDLGMALHASKKLVSLEKLVVRLSRGQTLSSQVLRHGLVRGKIHPQTNSVVWCPSLKLKVFKIEIMEAGEGCNIFRQTETWSIPHRKLL